MQQDISVTLNMTAATQIEPTKPTDLATDIAPVPGTDTAPVPDTAPDPDTALAPFLLPAPAVAASVAFWEHFDAFSRALINAPATCTIFHVSLSLRVATNGACCGSHSDNCRLSFKCVSSNQVAGGGNCVCGRCSRLYLAIKGSQSRLKRC